MANYIKQLPVEARPIQSTKCWIDPQGRVYGIETRIIKGSRHKHYGEYFQYKTSINHHNGYVYAGIKYVLQNGKTETRTRRVHILVAETFIPNPFHLPVVGHKNNIKTDNAVDNLYWTTIQENTQKAFDDGLLVNKKGCEDEQSFPVVMFNTTTRQELGRYGSIKEAAKATNIQAGTIARQCKYKKPVRKPYFFRYQNEEYITPPRRVVQFCWDTDEILGVFYNTQDAENKTGIPSNTIAQQCLNGRKPCWSKDRTYFLYQQ